MEHSDSSIFDLSPIPMWLEDYSEVKKQLDQWKEQGVENFENFLKEDITRVHQCAQKIKILNVNTQTLQLFGAKNQQHLCDHLHVIFQKEMFESHSKELLAIWEGKSHFSSITVNYTLQGQRLDIQLRATVLPEYKDCLSRVLVTTEDITAQQNALRLEKKNRQLAEAMFIYSPTSLWVEDFSRIKERLDQVRQLGITDFVTFLDVHPEFITACAEDMIVLDVNQATLDLFNAPNKSILLKNLHKIFSKEMKLTFKEQLIELWNGNIHHQREAINYALDGSIRNVLLQFTVFPGYEHNWSLIQVALTDITARKKAENYLEYLGKHDVLTKLYNRSFFSEEINRLERNILRPVSCIFLDMNGLKEVNDTVGHDVGDGLLRRVGNVLNQAIKDTPFTASRIGGDEFVILMPGADEHSAQCYIKTLQELFNIDNQYYSTQPISIALGHATSHAQETIEAMLKRADENMYHSKRHHYENNPVFSRRKT